MDLNLKVSIQSELAINRTHNNIIGIYHIILADFYFLVAKFSSSGREDVDVRTLGRGRPFMFEIVNSRKVNFTSEELSKIQDNINTNSKEIFVRDLQVVKK